MAGAVDYSAINIFVVVIIIIVVVVVYVCCYALLEVLAREEKEVRK